MYLYKNHSLPSGFIFFMVELRGFEPLTSTLPVWHSSQLS